ncbi:MAG TPA: helix-turn-helix transcriptional regulator [Thermomicrobiales bacterium]|nr:helix-turn-helix transcriptional regulator [Thermomicrobiales bacterium]
MEDRVLSQADIEQKPEIVRKAVSSGASSVSRLLTQFRQERGISKAELAEQTGLSPSSITRFEQGNREPERETILLLAKAMVLPLADRDRLLAAGGFRSELWDDPQMVELAQLMGEASIPEDARREARSVVRMAIAYLKLRRLNDS